MKAAYHIITVLPYCTLNKYFLAETVAKHHTPTRCKAAASAGYHSVSGALVCFSFLPIFVLTLCSFFFFFFLTPSV